jgi:uncharacterized membrane protein YjgN (DUF898 family)
MTDLSQTPELVPHRLTYTGRVGELFNLFIVNLLLTIVTLGTYRFWGKVRMRRYLWAHVLFQDEPFFYTGNGQELFKGFIKVLFMLVIPLLLIWQAIMMLTAAAIESLLLVGILGFFSPYIVFWVRRYRLSRSEWRGIRFRQSGDVNAYARKAIAGWLLTILTLFYYVPYNAVRLLDYQINRVHFGTMAFSYAGKSGDIAPQYRRMWCALLILFILYFISVGAIIAYMFFLLKSDHDKGSVIKKLADLFKNSRVIIPLILLVVSFYASILLAVLARLRYRLLLYRHVVRNTRLGPITAEFGATFWQFFRLTFGNFLLKLLSIGLLSPIATHRRMKFMCRHFKMQGLPDFTAIGQVPPLGQSGEGWTHWFDVDALDF